MPHVVIDKLIGESQDAFVLLTLLQRHHWGRSFVLANAMASQLGWTRKRFAEARQLLQALGLYPISCASELPDLRPSIVWVHGVVKIDHQ